MLIAIVMVMAACSDSSDPTPTLASGTTAPRATASTTTLEAATTTSTTVVDSTSTTTTTAPPDSSIPIPDTDGETDFEVIWRELMGYHNWAFENPAEADPRIYLADSCDCLQRAEEILAEYIDNGWRASGDGIIVHQVDIEVSSSTFALMTVIDEQAELMILGPDGEVVEVIERRPRTFFDVRVRLTDDGWRIAEWNQRGAEGAAE